MDFDQFQNKTESSKVVIAEVTPALDLSVMTLSTGSNTYYMPIEKIGLKSSGFYFHPPFKDAIEDGIALTHLTGPEAVDQTAGSWYFDETDGNIFVHTSDSSIPSNHSILGVFPLYFSTQAVTTEDRFYNPRISDVPISISSTAEDVYFSATSVGGGSISFDNSDSFFDRLSSKYIWKNRDISIAIGEKEMTVASYATIFTGRLRDRKLTDKQVSFSIQDKREYLHKNLPERVFSKKDYPQLDDAFENKPIPVAYGFFEKAPAYKIDTTAKGVFKFADHPILEVVNVYNNSLVISPANYSVNLELAEVTILESYSSTVEQITVTFYGVPGENVLFTDDFNDGDIEGWTYHATGGVFSWTPLSGKVRAACQDEYITFFWAPKKFSRGQIEAKVKPISGTHTNCSQGIVWDYEDADNYKYFVLLPVSDKARIMQRKNGITSVMANANITTEIGTEYTLKIDIGAFGYSRGYLNGSEIIAYDFAAHPTFKSCGLVQLNGDTTDFDDFSITLPYLSTGSAIVKDICTRWLNIPESDLNNASFTNSAQKARERIHILLGSSQERSEQVITRIGLSNLCRFLIGADGKVHYSFWDENESASISISEEMLLDSFESFDQTDDIFYKVKLNYGSTALNPSGTDEEYGEENVKHTFDRPYEKRFVTYLVDIQDAQKIALKLFQLVKFPILRVKIQTKVPGINAKVGDILELSRNRGFTSAGSLDGRYRIIGITKEIDLARTTLTLVSETDALGIDICAQTCQYGCEVACLGNCEINCQTTCEVTCQSHCQLNCQMTCELNCESTCEAACQDTCEASCQEACEIICKTTCETICQGTCQLACQAGCEEPCTAFCETHSQE